MTLSSIRSRPVVLDSSSEAKVYGLFALALALTVVGVFLGITYAQVLIGSGVQLFFLIAELIVIFTSRMWMRSSPLNMILFAVFPLLSGITVTPYILYVLAGYVNGASILLNACAATIFMAIGSAVFALTTRTDLSGISRMLFMGLIGLIVIALLQLFVPALRTGGAEVVISGIGVVLFAAFTAYDVQRVQALGRLGANPFLLALSLYLDIFNLFLSILRFMLALSGNRR
ncbi:MAG: Bax inhibitor-1/YccA family protein [Candidatus Peribacteraceae bacterium]|nr:Bax inhibitor-1/YccA family protein [Candidatus Peribacteraceae bacterium]MDD5739398.1 Bax inhibitor-1/YccA family protein [Candidatus Peribacteraceae bacterium]